MIRLMLTIALYYSLPGLSFELYGNNLGTSFKLSIPTIQVDGKEMVDPTKEHATLFIGHKTHKILTEKLFVKQSKYQKKIWYKNKSQFFSIKLKLMGENTYSSNIVVKGFSSKSFNLLGQTTERSLKTEKPALLTAK